MTVRRSPTSPSPGISPDEPTRSSTPGHAVVRRRTGLSVRTRIVVALAVMVAVALTAAGAIIYFLEAARLQSSAVALAQHELAEFATFQEKGEFTDADQLLYSFLDGNVASDNEMLVAWTDGAPRYVSTHQHFNLTEEQAFRDEVAQLAKDGGSTRIASSVGNIMLTVQPITQFTSSADQPTPEDAQALVVVSFIDDMRQELTSLMRTYAMVALLSLGTITLIARWQAGRLLAPLRDLNETARQIGSSDLSERVSETGNDDITALSQTVNDMLDRLEGSFTSQRTFLDDAGHELRTPLTVLRTHLELLTLDDPSEVEETRDLLLDEVDRMSRLVEDMTLLAKSNRPDFLRLQSVDVAQLTRSAFAKAVALGQRDWQLGAVATGSAHLDQQRVTQAVLQLAHNAVKHTDQDGMISIGSHVEGGNLRIWVSDSGAGVPVPDRALIFERFGRSRVRPSDEGFGLGLSIVKAIADAHGGQATVSDATPHGAEFSLILPLEASWPIS